MVAEGEELGSNLLHVGPTWRKATQRSGPQVASQNLANDGRSGKGRQRPFAEPKHPTVNFLACATSDGSPSSGVTLPLARKPVPAWQENAV